MRKVRVDPELTQRGSIVEFDSYRILRGAFVEAQHRQAMLSPLTLSKRQIVVSSSPTRYPGKE